MNKKQNEIHTHIHTHTSRATSNVGVVGLGGDGKKYSQSNDSFEHVIFFNVIDVGLQFLLVYFSLIIQVFYLKLGRFLKFCQIMARVTPVGFLLLGFFWIAETGSTFNTTTSSNSQIPENEFLSASFCLYLSDWFISQVITAWFTQSQVSVIYN